HRLPEWEAGPRADVPAALLALEDEPTRPLPEEHPQEAGRRDVQVGVDALRFKFPRLVRPAAGDDRERRPVRLDRFELLRANLRRDEPEDANAPRPLPELRRRLLQELIS